MRDKRKKFVELDEACANRAIKGFRLNGNLANKGACEHLKDDAWKIFRASEEA